MSKVPIGWVIDCQGAAVPEPGAIAKNIATSTEASQDEGQSIDLVMSFCFMHGWTGRCRKVMLLRHPTCDAVAMFCFAFCHQMQGWRAMMASGSRPSGGMPDCVNSTQRMF